MLSRSSGFDLAEADEEIDQLDDGRPTLRRFHLGDDLLGESRLAKDMRGSRLGAKAYLERLDDKRHLTAHDLSCPCS